MHRHKIALRKIYSGDRVSELNNEIFTISVNVNLSEKMALATAKKLLKKGEKPVRLTMSLCPACYNEKKYLEMRIPALIFERDKEIWMRKKCSKHGTIEEKYWEDAGFYYKQMEYADPGIELDKVQIDKPLRELQCPLDCGLCHQHKSHTSLANLVVTNRCDLSCWYCFFYAKKNDPIYEPSLEQIKKMLRVLRSERPVPPNAIQLTGGEPALRKDIVDVVKLCKKEGFEHVQFNTNAIRFSQSPALVKKIINAGANVLYLSFDGVSPQTNPKNFWEMPQAIENVRKTKHAGIVLVPTVINGFNTHEIGDIIRFAAANIDVVRGVNFQPVSLVGMMPHSERKKQRITIPQTIKLIEKQTSGQIALDDFYTVPCVTAITNFIESITQKPQYRFSTHFVCGAATYVFIDEKNKFVPITRFVDVEGLFDYLNELSREAKKTKIKAMAKAITASKLLYKLNSFIDKEKQPKNLNLGKMLTHALISGTYDGLKEFHYKSLFIGMMHFQDLFNYDVDRVERCSIHYVLPDGRIVPFCAHNVVPELYRDKVQRQYSVTAKEWEKKNKARLKDDKYVRKITPQETKRIEKIYREAIEKFK